MKNRTKILFSQFKKRYRNLKESFPDIEKAFMGMYFSE
jgi:hypothetical protein